MKIPRCKNSDIFRPAPGANPEDIKRDQKLADEYLQIFAKPDNNTCLKCGSRLGCTPQDSILDRLTASFVLGVVSGEGICSVCGHPGRTIHPVPGLGTAHLILQYHPDYLNEKPV